MKITQKTTDVMEDEFKVLCLQEEKEDIMDLESEESEVNLEGL